MKPQNASARTDDRARFQQTKSHLLLRLTAVAATAAILAACTVAPKPSSAAGTPVGDAMDKTLLQGDALREAVVGYGFSHGMVGVNLTTEIFHADGRYVRSGRVILTGTYEIQKDAICRKTEMSATVKCDHLLKDPAGKFYFRPVDSSPASAGDLPVDRYKNRD